MCIKWGHQWVRPGLGRSNVWIGLSWQGHNSWKIKKKKRKKTIGLTCLKALVYQVKLIQWVPLTVTRILVAPFNRSCLIPIQISGGILFDYKLWMLAGGVLLRFMGYPDPDTFWEEELVFFFFPYNFKNKRVMVRWNCFICVQ